MLFLMKGITFCCCCKSVKDFCFIFEFDVQSDIISHTKCHDENELEKISDKKSIDKEVQQSEKS